MSLKHGLLGLLNYGDLTGYELAKVFEDSLAFFWQAQMSQIYRELNAMEKAGWLTYRTVIQTDKPNKKVYSITEQGRKELDDWLKKDLTEDFFAARNTFLMQLFFSAGKGDKKTAEALEKARDACLAIIQRTGAVEGSIRAYGEGAPSEQLYWEMTAQYGYAYYEMCCRWLGDCIRRLKEHEGGSAAETGGKEQETEGKEERTEQKRREMGK